MVRHMLFLRYTDEIRAGRMDEATQAMRESFSGMVGKIPGLVTAEIGENIAGGPYDVCLYCEFEKPENIQAYKVHPLHLAHNEMAKDWIGERACVDYITV